MAIKDELEEVWQQLRVQKLKIVELERRLEVSNDVIGEILELQDRHEAQLTESLLTGTS